MKILVTTPFRLLPANWGGAVRTIACAHSLAALGHQVTILSADEEGTMAGDESRLNWKHYRTAGRLGHFINRDFRRALDASFNDNPELVLVEFPFQSFMICPVANRHGVPIVYNAHNVEADRFRRTGAWLKSRVVYMAERNICRHANVVLTVSDDDRELLRNTYGCDSQVLPNGVDTDRFSPRSPDLCLKRSLDLIDQKVVLFFGTYDYKPNLEALQFLTDNWPTVRQFHPDAHLLVVGKNPPPWARDLSGVSVTGAVDDIAAHIGLAHVVAVPLISGGGTRLKILEALACGKTVVSTPFGASGLPENSNLSLRRVDIEHFVRELCNTLDNVPFTDSSTASQIADKFAWRNLVAAIDWERFVTTNCQNEALL